MKAFTFKARDGKDISVTEWDDVNAPIGVIQISHGMAEHSGRYDYFAREMNARGFIVFADDHRAHGRTDEANLGYCKGEIFNDTVSDMAELTAFFAQKYRLPIILFGHSYGSFLTQRYVELYGDRIAAAVIGGSSKMRRPVIRFGKAVASAACKRRETEPSSFFKKMSFDVYNKKLEEGTFVSSVKEECERYEQDKFCNFVCSNNFYRCFFSGILQAQKRENIHKIRKDLPILLLSGRADPVGDMGKGVDRLEKAYLAAGLSVKKVLYDGVRHEYLNDTSRAAAIEEIYSFAKAHV